jgi:anti-sigma factor ChrR (cupin superfamily)
MLSIVDKVKQNNYRTGKVLQMYVEAIHKARSLAANRLRMTALRSHQPTIERSFLGGPRRWCG